MSFYFELAKELSRREVRRTMGQIIEITCPACGRMFDSYAGWVECSCCRHLFHHQDSELSEAQHEAERELSEGADE